VEDRLGEADTLRALGDLQMYTDQLASAEVSYRQALDVFRQVKSRLGEANTVRALGDLQVRTGRMTDAEASYQRALNLYRQVGDRLGEANTRVTLGRYFSASGADDRAEGEFGAALAAYESFGDAYSAATTLTHRGQHRVLRRRNDGMTDWREALDLAATADLYLLGQVMVVTLSSTRYLLATGEADDYPAAALPLITDAASLPESAFPEDQRMARSIALAGFALLRDLAAVRASGLLPRESDSTALLNAARQVDRVTDSAYGLTALTQEILNQAIRRRPR
jgi:tetratricopeptide (TPR) repeat protein